MLTGILTKPANINKGQDNIMTLDRDALLADVVANKDSYFHQLGRWSQVLITYQSSEGFQLNHLEFDPTTGAFPTANFNPSARARNTWLVQSVMIRDLDDGEVIYYRDELDTAHFDLTLDQVAPTLTFVGISSDNVNPTIANVGDVITINFNSDEALQNVSATIAGQVATISGAGTSWTASYMLVGGEPSGVVSFTLDYQDLAGNQGTQVTSTTNGSSVTIQYVVPSVTTLQIQSDNVTLGPFKAVTGDTVTVNFTADGPIDNINMTINGESVVPVSTGVNQYEATYSVTAGSPDGNVVFIIDYTDVYNNPASSLNNTDITDNSFVEIDNTPPQLSTVTITSTSGSTASEGDVITLTFGSNETINTPTVTILGNPVTATNISGNIWEANYTVLATDPEIIVPFTIDFEDDHQNQGIQVTSTTNGSSVEIGPNVEVVTLTVYSDNTDPTRACIGNTITIDMVTNIALSGTPFVRFLNSSSGSYQVNFIGSGTNWTAQIVATSSFETTAIAGLNQIVDFYIFGAESSTVTHNDTTDNSEVRFYRVIDTVISDSNNPTNNDIAEFGDTVFLDFSFIENINVDSVSIAGNTVTFISTGVNQYQSQYTIDGTEGYSFNDEIDFEINYSKNGVSGNPQTTTKSDPNGKVRYRVYNYDQSSSLASGRWVDSSGDFIITGNPGVVDQSIGPGNGPGSANIKKLDPTTGSVIYSVTLNPTNTDDYTCFGWSVAIDGDNAIVGAPRTGTNDVGRVYIFNKDEGGVDNWGLVTTLSNPTNTTDGFFGYCVDISGNYAIATASSNFPVSGNQSTVPAKTLVYEFTTSWSLKTELDISSINPNGYFGYFAAIDGDVIAGLYGQGDSILIFNKDEGGVDNWGLSQQLIGANPASVCIDGDILVTGDTSDNCKIYYKDINNTWNLVKSINERVSLPNSLNQGRNTAIDGDYMCIIDTNGTDSPKFIVYNKDEGGVDNWGSVYSSSPAEINTQYLTSISVRSYPLENKVYVYECSLLGGSSIYRKDII